MTILDYFKHKPKPVRAIVTPSFRGMGLNIRALQYRQNDELVSAAMAITNDPRFQQMLEVVRNEDPARFPLKDGSQIADRAIHQAMSEGYSLAVETMLALAKPWKETTMPEETFEIEIINKNEQ